MKPNTLMILLLSFGLVSCGPSIPSSPQPSQQAGGTALPALTEAPSDNTPSSSTPMPTFAPILVLANSTVVEFLVDKSGSVDKNCPNNKRYDFVNFVVKLMKKWTQFPNAEKLYVGVAQFGSSFDPSLQPTDITTLNNFSLSPDKSGTADTLFESAIIQAADQMSASNAKDRILVILTDGEFASNNIDDVESGLGKFVGQNLNVYIGLLCPDPNSPAPYIQDWYNKLNNKMIGVKVFGSAEETGVEVLRQLKVDNFLPSDFTPLFIPTGNTAKIPGYATKATFSYWSASEQPLNVDLNGAPFVTVLSSKLELKDIDPTPNCSGTQFQIESLDSPWKGLLLISYATFNNIDLSINLELPANEIINNAPAVVKVTATDKKSVDIGRWRYCYSFSIATSSLSGELLTPKQCEPGLSNCVWDGNNSFYAEWNWKPSFDHPQNVVIQANLINPQYNVEITNNTLDVPIEFQAQWSDSQPLSDQINPDFPNIPLVAIETGKIKFNYVASNPQIYLLTTKSQADLENITKALAATSPSTPWIACPMPSTSFHGNSAVDLTNYNFLSTLPLRYVYVHLEAQITITPFLPVNFQFQTFPYVLSECGYSQIEFKWNQQNGSKAIAWTCNLNNNLSCTEDPSPK